MSRKVEEENASARKRDASDSCEREEGENEKEMNSLALSFSNFRRLTAFFALVNSQCLSPSPDSSSVLEFACSGQRQRWHLLSE